MPQVSALSHVSACKTPPVPNTKDDRSPSANNPIGPESVEPARPEWLRQGLVLLGLPRARPPYGRAREVTAARPAEGGELRKSMEQDAQMSPHSSTGSSSRWPSHLPIGCNQTAPC